MDDAASPTNEAADQAASAFGILPILQDALHTLSSSNRAAASVLVERADDGTLQEHMTRGEITALADALIETCQTTNDEN